ncbi:MAG: hypothetical protein ABII27_05585 [bacterium]
MSSKVVLCGVIFLCFAVRVGAKSFNISSSSNDAPVTINAEHLEYHKDDNVLFAVGSAVLEQGELSITAESIILFLDKNVLEAYDNILFREKDSTLIGKKLIFNWEEQTGTITDGSGSEKYWRYFGKEIKKVGKDKIRAYRSKFTSCEENPPHYYIYGRSAAIRLKKWMVIKNAFLLVDNVPIFYTPIFFRSLKDRRVHIRIRPGYSNSEGIKILSEIGYPTSDNTYLKVLIDYYEEKGTGKGLEFDYYTKNAKGSFYGYTIRERDSDLKTVDERWNLRFNHWQQYPLWESEEAEIKEGYAESDDAEIIKKEEKRKKKPPSLYSQANLEFQSDTTFNNDYFKDAYKRVVQELDSSVAITHQTEFATTRVSAERVDSFNQEKGKFEVASLVFPRVDFSIIRRRISELPLYLSYNNYYTRTFNDQNNFYRNAAAAQLEMSNDIKITRNNTLSSSVGWAENWEGRVKKVDLKDAYIGKYTTGINLRNRLTYMADLDLGHSYRVRMKQNTTKQDILEIDKGIELNKLSAYLLFRPTDNLISRTSTGYDLHRNRGEVVKTIVEKMDPVSEEIEYKSKSSMKLFGRTTYEPFNHYMGSLQLGFSIYPSELYSFEINSNYNKGDKGDAVFRSSLRCRLFERWYINGTIGFKATGPNRLNYERFNFYEREVKVVRDLHCFIFSVLYRRRGESEDLLFNLELKTDYLRRQNIASNVRDYEFYPWREK